MNKRLFISSILLTVTVFSVANFDFIADAVDTCNNYDRKKGRLYAKVDLRNGKSTITNESDKCAYKVGVASFKILNKKTGHPQELYDVKYGVVKKNSTLTLNIKVPHCAYQFDTFVGKIGKREGIDHVNDGRRNLNKSACKEEKPTPTKKPKPTPKDNPTPTPTDDPTPTPTDDPTPTPTDDPTPTPTDYPTPTPTTPDNGDEVDNNNENENNNNNENNVEVNSNIENNVNVNVEGAAYEYDESEFDTTVYPPQEVTKTPSTGAGALSLLALIPSGIAGVLLRRKLS